MNGSRGSYLLSVNTTTPEVGELYTLALDTKTETENDYTVAPITNSYLATGQTITALNGADRKITGTYLYTLTNDAKIFDVTGGSNATGSEITFEQLAEGDTVALVCDKTVSSSVYEVWLKRKETTP